MLDYSTFIMVLYLTIRCGVEQWQLVGLNTAELTNEYEELDSQAVSKGLDMGYKLKGKYTPEKIEHSGEITETLKLDRKTDKIIEKVLKERKKDI